MRDKECTVHFLSCCLFSGQQSSLYLQLRNFSKGSMAKKKDYEKFLKGEKSKKALRKEIEGEFLVLREEIRESFDKLIGNYTSHNPEDSKKRV